MAGHSPSLQKAEMLCREAVLMHSAGREPQAVRDLSVKFIFIREIPLNLDKICSSISFLLCKATAGEMSEWMWAQSSDDDGLGWILGQPCGPFQDRYQLIPTIPLLCGQFSLFLPKWQIRKVVQEMQIKLFCIPVSFHVAWYVWAPAWVRAGRRRPGFLIWEDFK